MVARRTQRADVLIEEVGINGMGPQVLPGKLQIVIQNFGPTRATNVEADVRVTYDGAPEGNQPPLSIAALAAGQQKLIALPPFNKAMTRATWEDIKAGRRTLGFSLKLTYTDVFETTYPACFSGIYLPDTNMWIVSDENEET
jgi:hypothetical protein